MKNRNVYIYGLLDPISNQIRYIGKSVNTEYRYSCHCNAQNKSRSGNWIKSIRPLKPEMIILEEVVDNWQESEMFWIAYMKSLGARLTNVTNGGEGTHGRILSKEVKLKISKSKLGKQLSQESINKMIETKKNWSEEKKLQLSNKLSKRITSESTRKKMSASATLRHGNRPKKISNVSYDKNGLSAREKMSLAAKNRKHSEETKAKISASRMNQKHTKETLAKISKTKKNWSEERKLEYKSKIKNFKHSVETKLRMSESAKHRPPMTEATKLKMAKTRVKNQTKLYEIIITILLYQFTSTT